MLGRPWGEAGDGGEIREGVRADWARRGERTEELQREAGCGPAAHAGAAGAAALCGEARSAGPAAARVAPGVLCGAVSPVGAVAR